MLYKITKMKHIIALFFSLVVLLPASYKTQAQEKHKSKVVDVIAQEKAKTNIVNVKEKDQLIRFMITSSKPFIFANNRYILHIGNKEIYRNEQYAANGKGFMTFLIPEDDFNALQEGADIYLTYGKVSRDGMDMDAMNKADYVPFWSLGKFSKTLLTK